MVQTIHKLLQQRRRDFYTTVSRVHRPCEMSRLEAESTWNFRLLAVISFLSDASTMGQKGRGARRSGEERHPGAVHRLPSEAGLAVPPVRPSTPGLVWADVRTAVRGSTSGLGARCELVNALRTVGCGAVDVSSTSFRFRVFSGRRVRGLISAQRPPGPTARQGRRDSGA